MRRKDREVADLEGQLAILEQCPVCRVAINDRHPACRTLFR